MPLFQKQSPAASRASATASSGFSTKLATLRTAPASSKGRAGADVAVAGLGAGRRDAEGDEVACLGDGQRELDRPQQCRGIRDQVIRRADPQHRVGSEPAAGVERRQRDRGSGVASAWLEQPVRAEARGHLGQLRAHQEVVACTPTVMTCSGAAHASSRRAVCCSKVSPPMSRASGLGKAARLTGQRRVPAPPARITGTSRVAMVTASGPTRTCGSYRPARRRSSPPRSAHVASRMGRYPTASPGGSEIDLARENSAAPR